MFRKSKNDEVTNPTAASNGVAEGGYGVEQGELLVEQLFLDEQPRAKDSKLATLAEDAEFVDVETSTVKAEPAQPAEGSKRSPDRAKRPGILPGLLSKRLSALKKSRQKKATESSQTAETMDLIESVSDEVASNLSIDFLEVPAAVSEYAAAGDSTVGGIKEHQTKPGKSGKKKGGKLVKSTVQKHEKAIKPNRRRSRDIFVCAQIAGDRSIYWKLTARGVEPIEALPADAQVLSFAKKDLRFEVETRISHRAAEALALQEVGDAVYILNRSKDLRAVYATLQARIRELPHRIGPGQLVLDHLVKERAPQAEALIVALELKDPSDRDALLILYYLSATGRSSEPQISVYPDNREFLLSQFAATHQATRENAQVLLVDHAALLEAAARAEFYPNEQQVAGIPVRQIWSHAAAVGLVTGAISMGWAYQAFKQNEQARSASARVQFSVEIAQQAISSLLSSSPRALAKGLSLDTQRIMERSHELWVPGSRVQVMADGSGTEYRLTLPLVDAHTTTAVSRVYAQAVSRLLHLEMPADCEGGTLNFSGTFNEAQLNVRCEAAPHPLDRYRGG